MEHNLDSRFTFSSFVPGAHNRCALKAALLVSRNPGRIYNPLLISSRVGMGKTHLITAIGHEVLSRDNKKVLAVTSEMFMNQTVEAIRSGEIGKFRNRYSDLDVLLVDSIHYAAGKKMTQRELLAVFRLLLEKRRQIVVTSDIRPASIRGMSRGLRSFLDCGLTVNIGSADVETKTAILRRKAREDGREVPEEVVNRLAGLEGANIALLMGHLLLFYAGCNIGE